MKEFAAYMVIDAAGRPGQCVDSGLRIKTKQADAAKAARFLDHLERDWQREHKRGPHRVIEVTITPKS